MFFTPIDAFLVSPMSEMKGCSGAQEYWHMMSIDNQHHRMKRTDMRGERILNIEGAFIFIIFVFCFELYMHSTFI
jgi:hypothetical protein